MNLQYGVFVNAEDKGVILEIAYRTDDESEAVNYFNRSVEFYGSSAVYVISLKRWSENKYISIKTNIS